MDKFSMMAALGVLALLAVARAMPKPGSDSLEDESFEARELMEELPEIPESTEDETSRNDSGLDEAYVALTEAMQTAWMCANTSVDLENIMSDVNTLSNETRSGFFSQYCPQLERAGLCLDDLLNAARSYFKEDVFIIVKALAGNYPDAVDLICKNDGEIIFKLSEPTTKQCFGKLWDEMMEYALVTFFFATYTLDMSHLTESECETLYQLRQYIEGELNVCKALDVMSVYDLFHNTLFSVTTCRNYVPTETEIENNTLN
ncbi:uncharacterized protein LOC131267130 [Anopheles coustani]|uniref:uncharacterized protein LOC131267130 n=1 Tax=Anopheles coustani TaxID=139045 RepID=UPI00265AED11|nr:uncharacterized protein LOC131267130 [Anopheles coustani]